MEHGRQQLTGDLIHVRDHQKKTLRSGIGGGQRACGQRAVHGAGGACFGLHFRHADGRTEDVFLPLRSPLVYIVGHGRGGRDRVNARDFRECIGDIRGGIVPVHRLRLARDDGLFRFCHDISSLVDSCLQGTGIRTLENGMAARSHTKSF